MNKIDYKKDKELYNPTTTPSLITVPIMKYVVVEGKGDPNTSVEYKQAIELVYGLSYTIKMSKMSDLKPKGYFEYVVPPLEGLWWGEEGYFDGLNIVDKDKFYWKCMIRLPEFVTVDFFNEAKEVLKGKKPKLEVDKLKYELIDEGLCVQIMHQGPFDGEAESVIKINEFMSENNLASDLADARKHHEIYLSDFRRTKPEKLRTIIRHPVIKND